MAREAEVPLMFTLAQLSYWSAKHLGDVGLESMRVRGRMQEGMVADIVVFDPEKVKEGSSYKAGEQGLPPIGLPHVIVNGVFVKRDDKATNQFPGQPIRYPVEDAPRHVAASQKQWLNTYSIDASSIAPKQKPAAPKNDNKQSSLPKTKPAETEPASLLASRATGHDHAWWGDQPYHALNSCSDWHYTAGWHDAELTAHR